MYDVILSPLFIISVTQTIELNLTVDNSIIIIYTYMFNIKKHKHATYIWFNIM